MAESYEFSISITKKGATVDDILALIERLESRLGKGRVVIQAPGLASVLQAPRKAIEQMQALARLRRDEAWKAKVEEALKAAKAISWQRTKKTSIEK